MIVAFFSLFIFSGFILKADLIGWYQNNIASELVRLTGLPSRYFNLGTMTIRVEGWRNLTENRELWSFFGLPNANDVLLNQNSEARKSGLVAHDAIFKYVVTYGLVPMAIGGVLFLVGIAFILRKIFALRRDNFLEGFVRMGVANYLLLQAATSLAGGARAANPVPLFVNTGAALAFLGFRENKRLEQSKVEKSEEEEEEGSQGSERRVGRNEEILVLGA